MRSVRIVALACACAAALAASSPAPSPSRDDRLARLARVAELYGESALGFACHETISYQGPSHGRIGFAYIFVHENGLLRDYRTWKVGTTRADRGKEVDPLHEHVPRYIANALLFTFVFRTDRQPLHSFYNLGNDEAMGRPVTKIGFEPKGTLILGENDWVGVAWVDRRTSQIVKVEAWRPPDWDARARRESDLATASSRESLWESESYEIEGVVAEFGIEKNGMRFPSKVTTVRTVSKVLGGKRGHPLHEYEILRVTQEYSEYEFFSVRTSEEVQRIVDGGAGAGGR